MDEDNQAAAVPLLSYMNEEDPTSLRNPLSPSEPVKMAWLKQTRAILPPRNVDTSQPRQANMRLLYSLTAVVSLGALLFGYDQGVMGVIVADDRWIKLHKPSSPWVTGAVISLYDIGCMIGAMSIGWLADAYGRERMISVASVIFVIGAVLQAASYSIAQITIGRIVLGVGVGICAGGVPLYISEISPPSMRGRIVGIEQMILCLGELIAFWLNYAFNMLPTPHWWRIPLAIQILPAIIMGIGCWTYVLPSPRWLVNQGRFSCAKEVLTRLHGSVAADRELADIRRQIETQKPIGKATWRSMFTMPVLRLTLLGTTVQFFQQITGTNSILYYTPDLFRRGGITSSHTRNLATGGVGIVLFISAWIPIFLFDKLGRKTWLQLGLVGMCLAMIGISTIQWNASVRPHAAGNAAIIAFPFLFYTCFNATWGVGSWTYASEIWPIRYRAKGSALSTASLWLGTFCVAQLSLVVADKIGWGLYVIYAGICVLAFVFVRYAMVETRGKTLEEMTVLFGIDDDLVARGRTARREESQESEENGVVEEVSPMTKRAPSNRHEDV